jgi:hypothetical protein
LALVSLDLGDAEKVNPMVNRVPARARLPAMRQFKHFMCQSRRQSPARQQLLRHSTLCAAPNWRSKQQVAKRPYCMHALILCEA